MNLKNAFLTLILAVSFNGIFANNFDEVSKSARNSFEKEFTQAENVQWTVSGPLTRATFTMNGEVLNVYYTESGSRYAVGKNVNVANMPSALIAEIKKEYRQYWITDAFEITMTEEKAFYITVENADRKIILKSFGTADWMVYKTTSKE